MRFSNTVLSKKEKHGTRVEHEKERVRQEKVLVEEDKTRGPGFWIPHTLYLPKDINHSQPTQVVSFFFVKVPADRFLNLQWYHPDEDDNFTNTDKESLHCSPQFWYSKDCETKADYIKQKGTVAAADLPASDLEIVTLKQEERMNQNESVEEMKIEPEKDSDSTVENPLTVCEMEQTREKGNRFEELLTNMTPMASTQ